MNTAKMTGAGLLTLALTLTPGITMAQSEADEMPPTPAYVTSTEQDAGMFPVDSDTEALPWGTRRTVGFSMIVESTDPRITGDLDVIYTYDQSGAIGRGAASATTAPTPPAARLPRCIRCQSAAAPSTQEYWHMGETAMRLRSGCGSSCLAQRSLSACWRTSPRRTADRSWDSTSTPRVHGPSTTGWG